MGKSRRTPAQAEADALEAGQDTLNQAYGCDNQRELKRRLGVKKNTRKLAHADQENRLYYLSADEDRFTYVLPRGRAVAPPQPDELLHLTGPDGTQWRARVTNVAVLERRPQRGPVRLEKLD